jgi:hypothetical protein
MSVPSVHLGPHGIHSPNWDYRILDDPQERAAILEYDGGLTRTEAKRQAGLTGDWTEVQLPANTDN